MGLDLPEGEHRLAVGAIDPSGNSGSIVNAWYTVVETKLRSAPVEGSTVSAVDLRGRLRQRDATTSARSDRGAFAACGRAPEPGR